MSGKKNKLNKKFAETFGYTSKSVLRWYKQQNAADKNLISQDMIKAIPIAEEQKKAKLEEMKRRGEEVKRNFTIIANKLAEEKPVVLEKPGFN